MRHVSEVANGLGCGLRCAGCGARLVARHPRKRVVAHLAHHSDEACAGAGETTLHRVAKEIILEAKSILLPEAVASVDGAHKQLFPARRWRYEVARDEVVLPGLVPDVIVGALDRELHIEIRVTHPCGPEKVSRLRERRLSSIEIDLSRVPRLGSREEHAEAVLSSAPRKWLNNLKVADEEGRLRVEAARKADQAAARRRRGCVRVADDIAGSWGEPQEFGPDRWVQQAEDAGYGSLVGMPVKGDPCFKVDSRTWQSAFIKHVVLDLAGHSVEGDGSLKRLQSFGMLKEPFKLRRDWNAGIVSCVRDRLQDFSSPCEAIGEYAAFLVSRGALVSLAGGRWSAPAEAGLVAKSRMASAEGRRARGRELEERLEPVRRALDHDHRGLLSAWMSTIPAGLGRSPADLMASGGQEWIELLSNLDFLKQMLSPGGWALPEEGFLGLPLSTHADARHREEEARRAATEGHLRDRRRRDAARFVEGLARDAEKQLGMGAGRAWLLEAIGCLTQAEREDGRLDRGARFREQVEADLLKKVSAVAAIRAEQERQREARRRADATAAYCRAELEDRASRRFPHPDAAALWLRGRQNGWIVSHWDYCTDQAKLEECRKLLEAPHARRRR